MGRSLSWRVRSSPSTKGFADRLVLDQSHSGVLDLRVHLLADPRVPQRRVGLLRPLVAASTSEGIRRDTGMVSWLHWPDLVTIENRVVARTTLAFSAPPKPSQRGRISMGVTVSCFPSHPHPLAPPLPSTSIEAVLGVRIDLALLRDKVLHAIDWYYAEWERGMDKKLSERILPTIPWIGREVEVRLSGRGPLTGLADGLDDSGSLLLDDRTAVRVIHPEEVEFVRVADS